MAEYESEVAELLESLESESIESEASEASEAAERAGRRFPAPRTPPRGGLQPVRRAPGYVTRVELTTALARVDGKINTVSESIKQVNTRLNTVSAERARVDARLKKEMDERKKDSEAQKKDFNSKVQMLALFPLLLTPPTYTIGAQTINATDPAKPVDLAPPATGMTNALLPLLLVGGLGGSGGVGSTPDGGMDNSMLIALALVLSQQPKSS
jgi:hypothetical protein